MKLIISFLAVPLLIALSGCGGGTGTSTHSATSPNGNATSGTTDLNARLTWQAPTTESDGVTPLNDLAGYKVYYRYDGAAYGAPIDIGNTTSYTVDLRGVRAGTYYFAVTAYDRDGNESLFSEEGQKTVP